MTDLNALKYTKTHEWVNLDAGQATMGITQHAQEEISDVVFVELPSVGKEVKQGDELAVVESVKAAFSIYAPVSGKIAEVNGGLEADPGILNESPYEQGWIVKLEAGDDASTQADALLDAASYEAFVKGGGHE